MAENYKDKGRIVTSTGLTLTDQNLRYGKFEPGFPTTSIPINTDGVDAFKAQGRKGEAEGCGGDVVYIAGDGTKFKMTFDCPYSADNACSIVAFEGSPGLYSFVATCPTTGHDIVTTYTIAPKPAALNSISAEELLAMPKCRDYGVERVAGLIRGRARVTLLDMLNEDFDSGAKLWCIVDVGLLDDKTAHRLACEFAEHALPAFESKFPGESRPRALLETLRGWGEGDVAENEVRRLHEPLRAERTGGKFTKTHGPAGAALEAALFAFTRNGNDALRNAGSCARAAVTATQWESEASWQIERVKDALRRQG
jgi:hypothetical protein